MNNLHFIENAIRPEELVVELEKLCEQDRALLMRHKEQFVAVTCPACDSNDRIHAFNKLDVNFDECLNCETIYASPRPTFAILQGHYTNSKSYRFWAEHIFAASEPVRREKIFKKRVDRVLNYCHEFGVDNELILEVGSGFGTFCEELKSRNFFKRIIAVEPTPHLAQRCRDKQIEVIEDTIENVYLNDLHVNVVVSFETIEHLFSPFEFLKTCNKTISGKGLLFITCPNMHGFDTLLLKTKSKSVGGEHLNLFNPKSINMLLEKAGFKILSLETPGVLDAELVRKSILAGEYDISGQPFLKHILIDQWERLGILFQKFLSENKLSSHMFVIARKCII